MGNGTNHVEILSYLFEGSEKNIRLKSSHFYEGSLSLSNR